MPPEAPVIRATRSRRTESMPLSATGVLLHRAVSTPIPTTVRPGAPDGRCGPAGHGVQRDRSLPPDSRGEWRRAVPKRSDRTRELLPTQEKILAVGTGPAA